MVEVATKYYEFNELSQAVQDKVINDTLQGIIETTNFEEEKKKNSNLYKAYKNCETMQTPWFLASYIYDCCKEEVDDLCSQYVYTADGSNYLLKEELVTA